MGRWSNTRASFLSEAPEGPGVRALSSNPLTEAHGAPLRLRNEHELGFKMVKWIRAIEFVESAKSIGKGEGGYAEDHEYFGELANI